MTLEHRIARALALPLVAIACLLVLVEPSFAQDGCGDATGYADSPWAGDARCPFRSTLTPFLGTRTNLFQWSATLPGSVIAPPAVGADGTLYLGTGGGNVFSVDGHTGAVKWGVIVPGGVNSTPSLADDGTLVVVTDSEVIYKMDPTSGATLYQATVATPVWDAEAPSFVIRGDGSLLVATGSGSSGSVVALSPSLTQLWRLPLPGLPLRGVAIDPDGTAYVSTKQATSTSKGLHAINKNGTLKWSVTLPASPSSSPVVGPNGVVLVGATNGSLQARKQSNGAAAWSYSVDQLSGNKDVGPPALYIDGTIVVGSRNDRVYALNPSGSLRWKYTTGNDVIGQATIEHDGLVYTGSTDGHTRALDIKTGAVVWDYNAGSAVHGGISMGRDGTVYFGTLNFQLIALGSTPRRPAPPAPPPRVNQDGIEPLGVTSYPLAGEQNCGPNDMSWIPKYASDGTISDVVWNPSPSANVDCKLAICDAAGVPVSPQPTAPNNSRFGSASDTTGETCAAVAALPKCGIDRSKPYGATCTADAQCGAGRTCAEICLDDSCGQIERRCATTLLGCGGLPQESNCRDIDLCPHPLASQSTEQAIAGSEDPNIPFDPRFDQIPGDDLPAPTAFPIGDGCTVAQDERTYTGDMKRGKMLGNGRWGVGFDTGLFYNAEGRSHGLRAATMEVYASINFDLTAKVIGHDIKILGLFGRVGAGTCGAAASAGIELGGHDIDLVGYSAGKAVGAVTGFDDFKNSQKDCRAAASALAEYTNRLKKAMLDAVEVHNQVIKPTETGALPNITSALCRRTAEEFSAPWETTQNDGRRIRYADEIKDGDKDLHNGRCDAKENQSKCTPSFVDAWLAGDVKNCDNPAFWTRTLGVQIAKAWIDDYDRSRESYEAAYNYLLSKLPKIKGRVGLGWSSDEPWDQSSFVNDPWVTADVNEKPGEAPSKRVSADWFENKEASYARDGNVSRYSLYDYAVSFPIGPISVLLAIEPSGYWGIGVTLDYWVQNPVGVLAVPTAAAAVNYVPRAGLDVIAYVGAGFGNGFISVSVGVEGILTLIEFRTPLAVGLGLVRPEQPDNRPIHPDLLPTKQTWYGKVQNKWELEFMAGAAATVDTLRGKLNLAARLQLWKKKKTFRKQIAKFNSVWKKTFNWVGTVDIPILNSKTLGWTRAEVTYPQLPVSDLTTLITPLGNGLNEAATYGATHLGYTVSCLPSNPPPF